MTETVTATTTTNCGRCGHGYEQHVHPIPGGSCRECVELGQIVCQHFRPAETRATATTACHVVRCLTPAAWQLTIEDDGRIVTRNYYCATHAAQNVEALPRPGRRITLDALPGRGGGTMSAPDLPVEDGGQTVEVIMGQPETATVVYLGQLVDIDGAERVFVSSEDVRNGSGRKVGVRYLITPDAAQFIRASIAAASWADYRDRGDDAEGAGR